MPYRPTSSPDVDANELLKAIERHLADRGPPSEPADAPPVLKRKAGGRIAISGYNLLRLGDGDFAKGKRFMHGLVGKLRRHSIRKH